MPVHISDYLPLAYSSLSLSVGNVEREVISKGGRDMIHETLAPVFRDHRVDEKFGLGLLHRHFDLADNERLVEVNGVATPWTLTEISTIGGELRPVAWLFYEDKLVPYEYVFIGNDVAKAEGHPQPGNYPVFLEALSTRLTELGVHKSLSLRVHPGADFKGSVEFTVGRANISVAPSTISFSHTAEVSFFFDPGYVARGYAMLCMWGNCPWN